MNGSRFVLLAIVIAFSGCVAQSRTCHSFTECPYSLYSWKPEHKDPEKLREAERAGVPYLVEGTPPYYPKDAWDNKIEGEVTLEFDVAPDGKPLNIRVASASPPGVFDRAGVEALTYSKYTVTSEGAKDFKRRFVWSMEQ